MYDKKQDLIDIGLLNKEGVEDKLIGYISKPCANCGRQRAEEYKSGMIVCEKCGWDQRMNCYVEDKYYQPI